MFWKYRRDVCSVARRLTRRRSWNGPNVWIVDALLHTAPGMVLSGVNLASYLVFFLVSIRREPVHTIQRQRLILLFLFGMLVNAALLVVSAGLVGFILLALDDMGAGTMLDKMRVG